MYLKKPRIRLTSGRVVQPERGARNVATYTKGPAAAPATHTVAGAAAGPGSVSTSARQAWASLPLLGQPGLHITGRTGQPGGEVHRAGGCDQDIVLDPDADAA